MTIVERAVIEVLSYTHGGDWKKAFKVISPELVVTATRMHRPRNGVRSTTCVLTIGKPNYAVRHFIKQCQKAKEPFPVKKVQVRAFPLKKKKK